MQRIPMTYRAAQIPRSPVLVTRTTASYKSPPIKKSIQNITNQSMHYLVLLVLGTMPPIICLNQKTPTQSFQTVSTPTKTLARGHSYQQDLMFKLSQHEP